MPTLRSIFDRQGDYQDAMVSAFESHLKDIVLRAQGRTIAALQAKLSITDGVIDQTPANYRIMRTLNAVFMAELKKAGYERLVMAFVAEFRGTLPLLNEVLEQIVPQLQSASIAALAKDHVRLFTFKRPDGGLAVLAVDTSKRTLGYLAADPLNDRTADLHNLQPGKIDTMTGGKAWRAVLTAKGYQPEHVIGAVHFVPGRTGKTMYPGMVYVSPDFRRMGVATAMYDRAVSEFPEGYKLGSGSQRPMGKAFRKTYDATKMTPQDQAVLSGVQASTAVALEATVSNVAAAAMKRGLFSVGGMKFADLVETLTDKLQASIGEARTIADTGMSTFYRTATDRAFQIIEQDLPQQETKYRYSGPQDKLTRPFCEHLLEVDKGYTREQIGRMNNHQLPNVFLTGGGWNCRHQWILDVRDLEVRAAEAA